ncbi:MAG: hypothetical protein M0P74_10160 [Syntrophales bacterium]|jgi:hypothetical protein|nr:hypothetical protein [Syntrophales bacterium]
MMKKQLLIAVALLGLAAAGCKDKPKETPPPAAVPQATTPAPTQNSATATPPSQPAAAGHKGKVVATLDGGTYTFMQVEENGRKIWVGAKQARINVGDEIEYPESPFVDKFKSKALKRTFDKVYFVEKFKVNGK